MPTLPVYHNGSDTHGKPTPDKQNIKVPLKWHLINKVSARKYTNSQDKEVNLQPKWISAWAKN